VAVSRRNFDAGDSDQSVLGREVGGAPRFVDLIVVGDDHPVESDIRGVLQDEFDRFVPIVGVVVGWT